LCQNTLDLRLSIIAGHICQQEGHRIQSTCVLAHWVCPRLEALWRIREMAQDMLYATTLRCGKGASIVIS
jgi:hypothetical protein